MTTPDSHVTAHDFEIRLANLLRIGVALAASVELAGGIIYLSRHGHEVPAYHIFRGEPLDLRTINGVLLECRQFHGRGII